MTARSRSSLALAAGLLTAVLSFAALSSAPVGAAEAPVDLGTAGSYAVLAGSTVTNTGPTLVNGDLGLSPGTSVTNFPPGILNGTEHIADAEALQAKTDLVTAYNDAAGRTPETAVATELGGTTKLPGVYTGATLGITNTLTLDAQGDGDAVFIFKTPSTLITGTDSEVSLINGADPCNVFWQVAESATLGTRTAFQGTILSLQSITAVTGATVEGRLLARNAAVTLDTNTITAPTCDDPTTTTTEGTTTEPTSSSSTTEASTSSSTTQPSSSSSTTEATTSSSTTQPSSSSSTTEASTSSSTTEASTSSSTTEASTSSSTTEAPTSTEATTSSTTEGPTSISSTTEEAGSTSSSTTSGDATSTTDEASSRVAGPGRSGGSSGGSGTGSGSSSGSLARTGTSVVPTVVGGGLVLLMGLGIVVLARRRVAGTL